MDSKKMMRSFIFYLLLFEISGHLSISFAQDWQFNAKLNGKPIGEHTFKLSQSGNQFTLLSEAKFKVKFLFINAYQYTHNAKEQWEGNCLSSLVAKTTENGEVTEVTTSKENDKLIVSHNKGSAELHGCGMTFAYWNPEMLKQSKLLNPQTGEVLETAISKLADEMLTVKGIKVLAEKYRLTAPKLDIHLWYVNTQEKKDWVALRSKTPEGYEITYELK